jgi:hypothetical protein
MTRHNENFLKKETFPILGKDVRYEFSKGKPQKAPKSEG